MSTYPSACRQLTDGCAPAVCALSSLAADFDNSTAASLCSINVSACCAVLSSAYVDSGDLGVVSGTGNVATQMLLAPSGATIGSITAVAAAFGSLEDPTSTSVSGAAVQPAAPLLPPFVQYNLPPTTPSLAQIVVASSAFLNGVLRLPDTAGLTAFPPAGYRLFVHNADAVNGIILRAGSSTIQLLSGAVVAPSPTLTLPAKASATVAWTGTLWIASLG